jgi:hypothetical protein
LSNKERNTVRTQRERPQSGCDANNPTVAEKIELSSGLLAGVSPQMASHAYDYMTIEKVVTEPDNCS